jgi:hypothetical protein
MHKYARICIGAYFAYFAYICTPHFADVATGSELTPTRKLSSTSESIEKVTVALVSL